MANETEKLAEYSSQLVKWIVNLQLATFDIHSDIVAVKKSLVAETNPLLRVRKERLVQILENHFRTVSRMLSVFNRKHGQTQNVLRLLGRFQDSWWQMSNVEPRVRTALKNADSFGMFGQQQERRLDSIQARVNTAKQQYSQLPRRLPKPKPRLPNHQHRKP